MKNSNSSKKSLGVYFARLATLSLLLFAISCAPLFTPSAPPVRLQYLPDFSNAQLTASRSLKEQLVVSYPRAFSELNGDAILLLFKDKELRRLAGYRWSSTVPSLVQSSLVRGLEQSNLFFSVADERLGLSSRLRLMTDLEQFYLRYAHSANDDKAVKKAPVAVLGATFRLVDYADGRTIATLPLLVEEAATADDVSALTVACEKASVKMVEQILPWLVESLKDYK